MPSSNPFDDSFDDGAFDDSPKEPVMVEKEQQKQEEGPKSACNENDAESSNNSSDDAASAKEEEGGEAVEVTEEVEEEPLQDEEEEEEDEEVEQTVETVIEEEEEEPPAIDDEEPSLPPSEPETTTTSTDDKDESSDVESSSVDDSFDIDSALESIDVDTDFSIWNSFRLSTGSRDSIGDNDAAKAVQESSEEDIKSSPQKSPEEIEMEDLRKWQERLQRTEVYSRHYTPTPDEEKELQSVATFVGATSGNSKDLFSLDNRPYSILLKRGPILLANNGKTNKMEERELILLTHGFVLAKVAKGVKSLRALTRLVIRSLDLAESYDQVEYIRDNTMTQQPSFSVKTSSQEFQFYCSNPSGKRYWLDAWEQVLVQNRMHGTKASDRKIGWQHELVQTSLFSAAVTGSAATLQSKTDPNALDKYNNMGVLHYAVVYQQNHVLQHLLEDGKAFFDLRDGEGRTPMYYAQRDENAEAVELLQLAGASTSDLYQQEVQGALVNDVKALEEQKKLDLARREKEKHEADEAEFKQRLETARKAPTSSPNNKRGIFSKFSSHSSHSNNSDTSKGDAVREKANTATSAMNENMRLIQERGEKIEEMQAKTDSLEKNVAAYGDLAAQMKAKAKAKKWYNL